MAQSSLRQFYTVRKRPQEEHGSLKRRKLTEDTRVDLPAVGKDADPLSLPFTQPTLVSSTSKTASSTSKNKSSTRRSTRTRGRGQSTSHSRRRRKSPPLPATPSIVLPSPPPSHEQPQPTDDTTQNQQSLTYLSHTSSSTTSSKEATLPTEKETDGPSSQANQSEQSSQANPLEPSQVDRLEDISPAKRAADTPSSPAKRREDVSKYDEEDPLLLPSSPKSPKQDTSTSQTSKPRASDLTALPPPRSRKNLADKLKLASSNPFPLSSPSSSTSSSTPSGQPNVRKAPAKTATKPSAKDLAQKTGLDTNSIDSSTPVHFARPNYWRAAAKTTSTLSAKELAQKTTAETQSSDSSTSVRSSQPNVGNPTAKTPSAKELVHKTVVEKRSGSRTRELAQRAEGDKQPRATMTPSSTGATDSMSSSEAISRLYKLSARELAQRTEPERRTLLAVRRNKGKSPAPPTPQLHQFQSFVVESPTKSPSKQPAYQRFHNLARAAGKTPDLPLPYNYQVLLEKFRCTDTVVTMLQKRREICTFGKLKQAVGEMTRRKYENRNLGQMETVYPRAYIFRQEKNIPGIYDKKTYESYQLTIECNAREDGREEGEGEEGEKEKTNAVLDSSALLRRKKVFNMNLREIARRHHKQFLTSLNPPLEIPDEKVLRWHPAFQLDGVPDIEEAQLPKPPLTESYTTAQDVLNAAQGRLGPHVQGVLEGVASSSERKGAESVREVGGVSAPLDPALRGISQKLLEKIQQKEASRVKSDITRDPVQEKRLEMVKRMPQLARILRSLFVTEKKAAILWDTVVQKLIDSHTSCLPPDRVEEHLEFMRESLGGWLSVVEVRKRRFVKVNKNTDSQVLTARMEDTRKKLLLA